MPFITIGFYTSSSCFLPSRCEGSQQYRLFEMVMSKTGWRFLCVAILVLVSLVMGVGCSIDRGKGDLDCSSKTGLERDQCLSYLAQREVGPVLCNEIENPLVKEVCHREVIFKKQFNNELRSWLEIPLVPDPDCAAINDPDLKYMCSRAVFNPHMRRLFHENPLPTRPVSDKAFGECRLFDEHHAPVCVSLQAAGLARTDLVGAGDLCAQLEDEWEAGECAYIAASVLFKNIENDATEDMDSIMDFCGDIPHPSWRSECYASLAYELALIRPLAPLETIAQACEESMGAANYHCFDITVHFLPNEQQEDFCTMLDFSQRLDCYVGLWDLIAEDVGYDLSAGKARCDELSKDVPQDLNKCLGLIAQKFGSGGLEPFSLNIALCNEFPEVFRGVCFPRLAMEVDWRFSTEPSGGERICEQFPADFKDLCFYGLALGGAMHSVYDLPTAVENCEGLLGEFRDECFYHLGQLISPYSAYNVPQGVANCQQFPLEFRKICLDYLSITISRTSGDDMEASIARCKDLPLLSGHSCLTFLAGHVLETSYSNLHTAVRKCNHFSKKYRDKCFEFPMLMKDDELWWPLGQNLAWIEESDPHDYDYYLRRLSDAGVGLVRIVLVPWGLHEEWEKLGNYDEGRLSQLEDVLATASELNLSVILTLDSYGVLRTSSPDPREMQWEENPYNAKNGGPLESPAEFFTSEDAREAYKARLGHLVGEIGDSEALCAWEFWNEVDATDGFDAEAVCDWHREMAQYLKKIDKRERYITTSFADFRNGDCVWQLDDIDLVTIHYHGLDVVERIPEFFDEAGYDKPVLLEEFSWGNSADVDNADPSGEHLRGAIIASMDTVAAAGPMMWWWDSYIERNDLYHIYEEFSEQK